MASETPEPLLTTSEVAELLQLHPKQVYRLVRQGLPGRRVGGEWRFLRREVIAWVEQGGSAGGPAPVPGAARTGPGAAPPLVAANGDLAVEQLLALVNEQPPLLGFVQADRDRALSLLQQGAVVAAGSHGKGPPARLGEVRLARLQLVRREVGLVAAPGRAVPRLSELPRLRFASRPPTAGVVTHLEKALREAKVEPKRVLARAQALDSHRDVVCAVLRGEADVGLSTRAWAHRTGLPFRAIALESYGLLVRAAELGDPCVVRLCEAAQSGRYRDALATVPGYDPAEAGVIRYDPEPPEKR